MTDYKITPTISEGNIVYGVIVGIICALLEFIIPKLSIVIAFIACPLLLTKAIDKISPKLKYDNKFYFRTIISLILLVLITSIVLSKIF